jgi:hypothetical protein
VKAIREEEKIRKMRENVDWIMLGTIKKVLVGIAMETVVR